MPLTQKTALEHQVQFIIESRLIVRNYYKDIDWNNDPFIDPLDKQGELKTSLCSVSLCSRDCDNNGNNVRIYLLHCYCCITLHDVPTAVAFLRCIMSNDINGGFVFCYWQAQGLVPRCILSLKTTKIYYLNSPS